MSNIQSGQSVCGKPHKLEIFNPLLFFPILAVTVYLCFELIGGRFSTVEFAVAGTAAVMLTVAMLIVSIGRRSVRVWKIEDNVLHFSRGIINKCDMTLRLDRISSSEMSDNPVYSMFGGTRVKLYSSVSPRAVFSMILPKTQAAELINRTAITFGAEAVKPRRLVRKKYSALLAGMTSRGALIPLGMSASLCAFGYRSAEMHIIAAALWMLAALNVFAYVVADCRMSVCHVNMGYAIQTGFFGGHRIFVPDRAVIGMIETSSPVAAFSGAGRFELLCAGGRKITCLQWYDGGRPDEAARRMIGCVGRQCIGISDPAAVKRRYFKFLAADIVGIIAAWVISMLIPYYLHSAWSSFAFVMIFGVMLHCLTAWKCSGNFGVNISGSTLRVGGMKLLEAEYLTLHRGKFAVIRIRQNFFDRLRGTCTAEFIPKGCRRGVKCRCISYERIIAVAERIY